MRRETEILDWFVEFLESNREALKRTEKSKEMRRRLCNMLEIADKARQTIISAEESEMTQIELNDKRAAEAHLKEVIIKLSNALEELPVEHLV
ncbi:MAG: hypothetical protein AAGD92_09950 [Pseudomonadota bacterium]